VDFVSGSHCLWKQYELLQSPGGILQQMAKETLFNLA
jgi:hypothetical protein